MPKIIFIIIVLTIFLLNLQNARAEKYYNSLPMLDGKLDSKKSLVEPDEENSRVIKNENTPLRPQIDHNQPDKREKIGNSKDLAVINAEKNPSSVLDANTPKLDTSLTKLNNPQISDTKVFAEYQKDLNEIINILMELKTCITEGSSIQILSAKVSTVKFLTEGFRNKYANGNQSNFETFKLVQEVVTQAVYTRDFWLNSNKLTYNSHGMTDKILQTKLLQMTTEIDKLLGIMNIQYVLKKE